MAEFVQAPLQKQTFSRGSSSRRRLCVGITLWAATIPEISQGKAELLDEAAAAARQGRRADAAADERLPPAADER